MTGNCRVILADPGRAQGRGGSGYRRRPCPGRSRPRVPRTAPEPEGRKVRSEGQHRSTWPATDFVRFVPRPGDANAAVRVIHWFRSDLRVEFNAVLAAACRGASELARVFVLDDALLRRHREAHPRLRFLDACLHDLAHALDAAGSPPVVLRGTPHRSLPAFSRACKASLVTWNRNDSPYAKRRDRAVRRARERDRIKVLEQKDRVVFEGEEIPTGKGEAYTVYTPYRRAWWRQCRTERSRQWGSMPPRGPRHTWTSVRFRARRSTILQAHRSAIRPHARPQVLTTFPAERPRRAQRQRRPLAGVIVDLGHGYRSGKSHDTVETNWNREYFYSSVSKKNATAHGASIREAIWDAIWPVKLRRVASREVGPPERARSGRGRPLAGPSPGSPTAFLAGFCKWRSDTFNTPSDQGGNLPHAPVHQAPLHKANSLSAQGHVRQSTRGRQWMSSSVSRNA